MWPKKIKTEAEYERALEDISALMGCNPGGEESDRLELLSVLVGAYEDAVYPIAPPAPVDAIRFTAENQGLRPADLVPYFGSKTAMSLVMSGKRPLTLAMIRALHKGLGIPADTLIQEQGASLPPEIDGVDFSLFPLKRMAARGWLPAAANFKARAEDLVRAFAERAGDTVFGHAGCFRQGSRQNAKDDRYAVEAWRLGARLEASGTALGGKFNPAKLTPSFLVTVAQLSAHGEDAPLKARDFLAAFGVRLIHVPHLPRTYLDGGVFYLPDGPVIALTLRHDRVDYFWFTLLHDLAHLVRGDVRPDDDCLIEDLQQAADPGDDRELGADKLAADSAIPEHLWAQRKFTEGKPPSEYDVVAFAQLAGVHPAIVAGRVRFERNNYRILTGLLGQGKVRALFS